MGIRVVRSSVLSGLTDREEQLIIVANELAHIKDDLDQINTGLKDHMVEEEEYRVTLNRRVGLLAVLMGLSILGLDGSVLLSTLIKVFII